MIIDILITIVEIDIKYFTVGLSVHYNLFHLNPLS